MQGVLMFAGLCALSTASLVSLPSDAPSDSMIEAIPTGLVVRAKRQCGGGGGCCAGACQCGSMGQCGQVCCPSPPPPCSCGTPGCQSCGGGGGSSCTCGTPGCQNCVTNTVLVPVKQTTCCTCCQPVCTQACINGGGCGCGCTRGGCGRKRRSLLEIASYEQSKVGTKDGEHMV